MKLVDNWQSAWKWFSMQGIVLAATWETIPAEAKAAVMSEVAQGRVTFALLVIAALGRMIDQGTAQ